MAVTLTGVTNGSYGPYMLSDPNSQSSGDYYYVNWYNWMSYNGSANITITNTGGGSLSLGTLTNNGDYYHYDDPYNNNSFYGESTSTGSNCDGAVLSAGQSCVINMSYYYGYGEYSYSKMNTSGRPSAYDVTYVMPTSAGNRSFVVSWR